VLSFLLFYSLSTVVLKDVDNQFLAAMLDPFGRVAVAVAEMGDSISNKNTETQSLEGVLLYNRLLWSGIGLLLFFAGYLKFRLALPSSKKRKKKLAVTKEETSSSLQFFKQIKVPSTIQQFNFSAQLYQLKSLFLLEFKKLIRSTYFKIMILALPQAGKLYDTTTYILTYHAAEALFTASGLLYIVFIILFIGELVWNSRKFKVNHFEDAAALRNYHFVLPKLFALSAVVFVMLLVQWIGAFAYQSYMGTTHEFGIRFVVFHKRLFKHLLAAQLVDLQ